ncbi:hypothetical protein Dip510_000490 [Elusimicrobium posterum]|uniref:copper resistance protein NlpE N-terminal domain-containing protein n=1 Tax=Elusimicrobium posterum TaxID=3116653 RepID=UPI003C72DA7D
MKKTVAIWAAIIVCAVMLAGAIYLIVPKSDVMDEQEFTALYSGSFYGVLPCADCAGIETFLYIFPDHTFQKSEIYMGEDMDPVDNMGAWAARKNFSHIELKSADGNSEFWRTEESGGLKKLDMSAKEINSNLNYTLKRQP